MRDLIKMGLVLGAVFASTFVILRLAGVLGLEDIRGWFVSAHGIAPMYLAMLVIALLFADLLVAMPTLTISILAGYFLGGFWGAVVAATGMMAAGVAGYGLGRRYGTVLLARIHRDERKLAEIEAIFAERGLLVLFVCRAVPILPEVSCCLAGATRMPFGRFMTGFAIGTVPYAVIASHAGAVSSLDDPLPAILVFVALPGVLWLCWYFLFLRKRQRA